MSLIGRTISGLNGLATAICAAVVLLLVFHVTLEVVMRYVVGMPLKGTIQFVSLYYMTAITFLALGVVEQRDSHVVVEVLSNTLGPRGLAVCVAIGLVLSAATAAGLAWRTWGEAMKQFRGGAFVMEGGFVLPTWPTYFFLPVGFGLMLIVALYRLGCLATGRPTGFVTHGFDPGAPVFDDPPAATDGKGR